MLYEQVASDSIRPFFCWFGPPPLCMIPLYPPTGEAGSLCPGLRGGDHERQAATHVRHCFLFFGLSEIAVLNLRPAALPERNAAEARLQLGPQFRCPRQKFSALGFQRIENLNPILPSVYAEVS